jgi:DNA-binding MarR family transcriptional regulator/GNAT superfamily N-acetyltransferase
MDPLDEQVAAVRAFNRFYTPMIGLLAEGLAGTEFNLTEARVLFELAVRPAIEASALRSELGIDAGYLSRIVQRFEKEGLVTRERSPLDGRRQIVRVTRAGRDAFDTLDSRTAQRIRGLLAPLDPAARGRLLQGMRTVKEVLGAGADGPPMAASGPVSLRGLMPGDLGWVVARHGALYASEYNWNMEFEALVAKIVATFAEASDAERERAWIALSGEEPVGCVFCTRATPSIARLRCLLVEPRARGAGVGRQLVEACVSFARSAGYDVLTLWTNSVLEDARRLYERVGFRKDQVGPIRAFGQDLVEETWSLPLR